MDIQDLIKWLLKGDVSIQYQTYRDLLGEDRKELQSRIAREGWGKKFLSKRNKNGHWGLRFYQPKWTSSHYTLLDLRNLCISPDIPVIKETIQKIATENKSTDGGINPAVSIEQSDVCVNGMFLNYACYFKTDPALLKSVVDFIVSQHMKDGGFNCNFNRQGAVHSSLHSTLSILEGITVYQKQGYSYKVDELEKCRQAAVEFILQHQLYLSDHTGKVINQDFLKLTYPARWKYNILRALDYFQYANEPFDERMMPAIEVLNKKRNKDGTWNVQAHHPGAVHFEMEKAGKPSRWNTLIALRVLDKYC